MHTLRDTCSEALLPHLTNWVSPHLFPVEIGRERERKAGFSLVLQKVWKHSGRNRGER